jgi:hypothetical protein
MESGREDNFIYLARCLDDSGLFYRQVDRWHIDCTNYFFSPSWSEPYILLFYMDGNRILRGSLEDFLCDEGVEDSSKEWVIYNLDLVR